ncbi:MAG: DUF5690 family protein [Planctomycetota bacterium]
MLNAAAAFAGQSLWGIDYKVVLIVSRVAGYTLSKFIGLIILAELAVVGFGATPPPYNWWWLALHDLGLGLRLPRRTAHQRSARHGAQR